MSDKQHHCLCSERGSVAVRIYYDSVLGVEVFNMSCSYSFLTVWFVFGIAFQ